MQDCWAKEKTTRPAIEDVVERMMIWKTHRGSAPTQYRCENERALFNGTFDVALPIVTASELPRHVPPSMFDLLLLMAGKLPIVGVWLRPRSEYPHPGEKQKLAPEWTINESHFIVTIDRPVSHLFILILMILYSYLLILVRRAW